MTTSTTVAGITYELPTAGDVDWGQQLTRFFQNVPRFPHLSFQMFDTIVGSVAALYLKIPGTNMQGTVAPFDGYIDYMCVYIASPSDANITIKVYVDGVYSGNSFIVPIGANAATANSLSGGMRTAVNAGSLVAFVIDVPGTACGETLVTGCFTPA